MSANAVVAAAAFGWQLAGVAVALRGADPRFLAWFRPFAVTGASAALVISLLNGYWLGAGFCVVTLVMLFRDWWKRKGGRVAKLIGARGRAVIAGLLERLRDAVEPVPEGATA